jgi:DHA2 family multidrug resistance protein
MVTTLVARRSQFHQQILAGYTSPGSPAFQNAAKALAQHLAHAGVSLHEAQLQAYARLYRAIQGQASTLAYIDTYWVLAVAAAIMFFLSFVLKKNVPGAGGDVGVG